MPSGYGQYRTNDGNLYVHRLSYEHYVGPIPAGALIHHECQNRLCFNPAHLTPLDRAEHVREHASPTCVACGSDDWYYKPNGWRRCRPCHARAARVRRATR
jgi:hypothetical protein